MPDSESGDYWDGFSIYAEVSRDIHTSVTDAIDSYSMVAACHSEGAKLRPDDAAKHKANILAAANRLLTELKTEADRNAKFSDDYEAILDDWRGDDGRIPRLHKIKLVSERPGWLYDFVMQIHEAAWKLGYIKAGRVEEEDAETPEATGREMIEDVLQTGAV